MRAISSLGAATLFALTTGVAAAGPATEPSGVAAAGVPSAVLAQQTPPAGGQAAGGAPSAPGAPSGQPTAQAPTPPQPPTPPAGAPSAQAGGAPRQGANCPTTAQLFAGSVDADVVLDIPNLSVDQITLNVDQVHATVDLDARLAQLLRLTAGVNADIGRVNLDIRGVCAEAHLVVRLNNVAAIIDRTLTTIDRNPAILTNLTGSVGQTLENVTAPGGLGSQLVGTVGQTLNNLTQPGGLLSQTVNT